MKKLIYPLAIALTTIAFSPTASAIPGYSRQTNSACSACHFQSFPALNAMGRSFKAGGYTMMGTQKKIEGKQGLSLPENLNAGAVFKIRYQKTDDTSSVANQPTNKGDGQLQMFDELLLMVGGRVSENIGVQLELNLLGGSPLVENFKMPFMFDVKNVKAGVIPFTTAGQGVAYGFELLNTGAVRGQRIMEARSTFSAQQYIGTGTSAEGVALVASNKQYFANFSKWSPRTVGDTSGSPTANYLRLAFTPTVENMALGVGLQSWSGNTTNATAAYVKTDAFALDAQAQGIVNDMPLGVYLTYASAKGSNAGEPANFFNANPNSEKAITIAGQLGVMPGKATVLAAYRNGDTGGTANNGDNALMIGGTYLIVQNVQLQLNHEMYSGSKYDLPNAAKQQTTLMLFAAF